VLPLLFSGTGRESLLSCSGKVDSNPDPFFAIDEINCSIAPHAPLGLNIDVVAAHEGGSGLERVARDRPDLVLLDLELPGDPWIQLASGTNFTCARSTAGHVYCWGIDGHAGLGNGGTAANLPVTVVATVPR